MEAVERYIDRLDAPPEWKRKAQSSEKLLRWSDEDEDVTKVDQYQQDKVSHTTCLENIKLNLKQFSAAIEFQLEN